MEGGALTPPVQQNCFSPDDVCLLTIDDQSDEAGLRSRARVRWWLFSSVGLLTCTEVERASPSAHIKLIPDATSQSTLNTLI